MSDFFHENKLYYSPVEFALAHIGGTWKIPILLALRKQALRYGDLKNAIPHITDKMLTTQLRELENRHMVTRTTFREKPPRVEYALTGRAEKSFPAIDLLMQYGESLMQLEAQHIRR